MPPNNSKDGFKGIYAQVVEEALSILGEGTSLVTSYLEKRYSVSLPDTADNPQVLSEALDAAIDGGARVIQRRILRLLYEKMNVKQPSAMLMTVDFEGRVAQARKDFENAVKGEAPK